MQQHILYKLNKTETQVIQMYICSSSNSRNNTKKKERKEKEIVIYNDKKWKDKLHMKTKKHTWAFHH